MEPIIIKDKATHASTLAEIDKLMDVDPDPVTEEGKRLELLTHLVEEYERKNVKRPPTTPIDAIRFRMEQENLKQIDLVPFIGSRGKVSEVLSGKRTLTLPMIQALHVGLGIPARSLIQTQPLRTQDENKIDWERFPLKEMCNRHWVAESYAKAKNSIEQVIEKFFQPIGGISSASALYKQSDSFVRAGREMNRYALAAWTARVMTVALSDPPSTKWHQGSISLKSMQKLARLSVLPEGPLEAKNLLREQGISLVIERSLSQTYLDGAAIMIIADHPIIGLSLRYDRIDNFWFSLMHECAHISLHFGQGTNQFFDDLDVRMAEDPREIEADERALEALIPAQKWATSPARVAPTKNAVLRFARDLDIHPAIVAGRIRRERGSYHLFNDLVGHGRIRYLFGLNTED